MDLVVPSAATKGLDLISYVDDDCPAVVVGDRPRMRQIVINLLSNAVKFTLKGEVLLTATTAPTDDGRLLVTINVTDTGIGISPEGMSRLFRSFSQLDASRTRSHGGTGLGLTISQRLARGMGGDISVTSTPGQGSTFTATLTVGMSDDAGVEKTPAAVELAVAGLSVLVVDDNATNQRILDLQLTNLGMHCTTADTPAAALAEVADGLRYDVAVVDMHMPDMNGLELSAALRQTANAGSPILLLTSMGLRPLGASEEYAAVIVKPVKGTALREAPSGVLSHNVADVGRGLPPPVKRAVERELDVVSGHLGVYLRWWNFTDDVFFDIDRESNAIWLNSRYRTFLGGRPPFSFNDAPLVKTLLFLLVENLFQSAWWSAQDKDKLELWQALLTSAAKEQMAGSLAGGADD